MHPTHRLISTQVTATTVGYGDLPLNHARSRHFSVVYLLISTTLLTDCIGHVAARAARARERPEVGCCVEINLCVGCTR